MKNLKWMGNSSKVSKMSGTTSFDNIPAGVWKLVITLTGAFLHKVTDKFEFGHKVYGLENEFIDYTIKSFEASEKNMGILLNGLKGCGKTVTAKVLANRTGLPVILVDESTIGNLGYFEEIQQPLCFMFDEFEKIINHKDQSAIAPLLSFVDGTATATKHMMLFTSNDTQISEFFIDRPGRIRYIKNYGSLSPQVVKEILDDRLQHKEFEADILEWVSFFKFLTIDILMSIVNEVNIHRVGPSVFKNFFNADNEKGKYTVKYRFTNPNTGQSHEFDAWYFVEGVSPADHFKRMLRGDGELHMSAVRVRINEKGEIIEKIDNFRSHVSFDEDDFEIDTEATPGEFKLIFHIEKRVYTEAIDKLVKSPLLQESSDMMSESTEKSFQKVIKKNQQTYVGYYSEGGEFLIEPGVEYRVEAIYIPQVSYSKNNPYAF